MQPLIAQLGHVSHLVTCSHVLYVNESDTRPVPSLTHIADVCMHACMQPLMAQLGYVPYLVILFIFTGALCIIAALTAWVSRLVS